MTLMNIVVLEPLGIKADVLQTLARPLTARGHQITFYDTRANTVQEQISRAQGADVLIIANQPLGKEVLQACPRLKFISVAFTGVDHVDTAYAKEHHIAVCNAAAGLVINLRLPKLDWDSEAQPVKQSAASMAAVFGMMGVTAALAVPCFLLAGRLNFVGYFSAWTAAFLLSAGLCLLWLKKRGKAMWEAL